jgi:DNA-binding Lrp family transcriptional regulator
LVTSFRSDSQAVEAPGSNSVRTRLDATDLTLLRMLMTNARTANNALAKAAGVAPSTALSRVAGLRTRGVIRSYRAEVDLASLGLGLEAMISVRLSTHTREEMDAFMATVSVLPGVISLFFLAGQNDYLIQLAAPNADALRDFVLEHLSSHPSVQHTETTLVFEHRPGTNTLGALTSQQGQPT